MPRPLTNGEYWRNIIAATAASNIQVEMPGGSTIIQALTKDLHYEDDYVEVNNGHNQTLNLAYSAIMGTYCDKGNDSTLLHIYVGR